MQSAEHALVVVGAGAAGLWVAARAGELGMRALVLEKTPRTGTKVLASGGTHCNLTTSLPAAAALELFGKRGARFLRHGFRLLPPSAVREQFEVLGVPSVEAPLEKVFPASGRARDVRDALESWMLRAGAHLRLEAALERLERREQGFWLHLEDGTRLGAQRVVLAVGGKSYPKTGTCGDGYRWLAELGLPLVEPVPALVPLTSSARWVQELSGIALQDAHARVLNAQAQVLAERTRPVLFTHQGVSGPGAMDLSEWVARGLGRSLAIDLAPQFSSEQLRLLLIDAATQHGAAHLSRALPIEIPRRLFAEVLRAAEIDPELRTALLDRSARTRLISALKSFPIPLHGTRGFDYAEVTAGGLALESVDPGSMQVRAVPGLYVVGELLDLQGPIGGLNFQAAFATAEVAARAIAAS